MEVEGRWYLLPPTKEAQELEEAAAALLDLAGAECQPLFQLRSMLDLQRLGVECRRRGMELVIRWDGDCNLQGLVEVDGAIMASLRAHAAEGRVNAGQMTEGIRLTKFVGVAGLGVRYLSKEELIEVMLKCAERPRSGPVGVPMRLLAGVSGLHVQGCGHR